MARREQTSTTEWLRLDRAAAILAARGYNAAAEFAEAFQTAQVCKANGAVVGVATDGLRIWLPANPQFYREHRDAWRSNPQLDMTNSTMQMVLAKFGGPTWAPALVMVSAVDVERLWPALPSKPGPKAGALDRFADTDRALFPEITSLVQQQRLSPTAAATKLVERIAGAGTPASRIARLVKRYRQESKLG